MGEYLEHLGFGSEAAAFELALWHSLFDHLRLCYKHVHQIAACHEVKQEVQMVLVLERCVLQSRNQSVNVSYSQWKYTLRYRHKAFPVHTRFGFPRADAKPTP